MRAPRSTNFRMAHARRILSGIACCAICAARAASVDVATASATEDEPVVDAASLVQPALLSGPGFSVDPHVELRGYMAHFTLDTAFGNTFVRSVVSALCPANHSRFAAAIRPTATIAKRHG